MPVLQRPTPTTRRRFLLSTLAATCGPSFLSQSTVFARQNESARHVPWLAEVQQPPAAPLSGAPRLSPLLVDEAGRAIETLSAWKEQRGKLQQKWRAFLGKLDAPRTPDNPPALTVLAEDRAEGVLRQRVRYEVEPGVPTEAYVLRPLRAQTPSPGVAVFHSTVNHSIRQPAGVEGKPEKAFGLKLAQRGCVAICPRNYLWPTNDKIDAGRQAELFIQRQPAAKGMAKMLYDAQVAVDILARLPGVDASRLGCVGHSLGAKEVLYLAAFDQRIKATVSSEGGVGIGYSNWDAPWYLSDAVKQPEFAREHHELLALAAPRPFLLLGGDSADGDRSWPFIAAALPVYRLYPQRPRIGLFNHKQGHSVPPQAEHRIYEWFDAYL